MHSRTKLFSRVKVAAVGLGAAVLLAGCASSPSGQPETQSSPAGHDLAANISVAYWDAAQNSSFEKIISDFNKIYPKIKVTTQVTPYDSYFTKLQTEGTSKTLPDVFWMNAPNFQLYASNGLLAPVSKQIDTSPFPKGLNDLYTYDGVQYGIPQNQALVAAFYNKAIFDEAGVAYPTADWTLDQFHQMAKTISDKLKSKGIYGVTNGFGGGQSFYYDVILEKGGYIISKDGKKSGYDDPKTIDALKFIRGLVADGSSPTLQQLSDTDASQWFANGKSAMMWSGPGIVKVLSTAPVVGNIGVVSLPKGERNATIVTGGASVVAKDSKNKAAAEAFQNYLASKATATTFAKVGHNLPAYKGTADDFLASVPFDVTPFTSSDNTFPYPISKNSAAWVKEETTLLPEAFSGKRPVEEVAKELATKMNDALSKE